jgi:hypothetical protein
MSQHDLNEQKALEALVAASLRLFEHDLEISDLEAEAFCKEGISLSPEDSEALERLGNDPIPVIVNASVTADKQVCEEPAALHRDKNEPDLEPRTLEEIQRKREEILARLRAKKGQM